ncbi:uncharacterized protein [Euphorbia lathyris]|uniref:uncharacterized protein n=1 Tax=Euphorbia lathyris TaxID=212925 RepID=UPI003313B111
MAALQKFKLLATQCGVAQSPTRSPRTSPLVHLRRKKTTLRMLLTRTYGSGRRSPRRQDSSPIHSILPPKKRDSLKDLFVSSPPFEVEENKRKLGEMISAKCEVYRMRVNGLGAELSGSPRPGWIGFRYRSLIRRAWRPMLIGIPEDED